MSDGFSKLSDNQRIAMKDLLSKWDKGSDTTDSLLPHDWKTPALEALKVGDVQGIQKAVAPSVQYGVAQIALNSPSDATRLQASQLILAQAGFGPIQRVEQSIAFDKMTRDQLMAVVNSKLSRLKELDPELDFNRLLSSPKSENSEAVDAEFAPVQEAVSGHGNSDD